MKTKRVLSALLVLAMVLALVIPAAAAEAKPPVFTKPLGYTILAKPGTLTLTSPAKMPEGVKGTVKYQWYESEWLAGGFYSTANLKYTPIKGATSATLKVTHTLKDVYGTDVLENAKVYYVSAYYKTADGKTVAARNTMLVMYDLSINDWYTLYRMNSEASGTKASAGLTDLLNTPNVLWDSFQFWAAFRLIRLVYG